jgi:hypothetical protein
VLESCLAAQTRVVVLLSVLPSTYPFQHVKSLVYAATAAEASRARVKPILIKLILILFLINAN